MGGYRIVFAFLFAVSLLAAPAYSSSARHASTSGKSAARTTHHRTTARKTRTSTERRSYARRSSRTTRVRYSRRSRVQKPRGQQAIEPERVIQIQEALIRVHYLDGEPSGKWDATTIAAMQKFQADNGWQTKLMPDSRALMKLGLGPDYSNAINAKDSAEFTAPPPVSTIPTEQAEGFGVASGVNQ